MDTPLARTIAELACAPLLSEPWRIVTFEHLTTPRNLGQLLSHECWRVRWRRDDGTHRGSTFFSEADARALFHAWTGS
jgi:hypothetical protein